MLKSINQDKSVTSKSVALVDCKLDLKEILLPRCHE